MDTTCLKRAASLVLLLVTACSTREIPTCVSHIVEKKSFLGDAERDTSCTCNCPPSASPIEAGGIVGGLLSLFKE